MSASTPSRRSTRFIKRVSPGTTSSKYFTGTREVTKVEPVSPPPTELKMGIEGSSLKVAMITKEDLGLGTTGKKEDENEDDNKEDENGRPGRKRSRITLTGSNEERVTGSEKRTRSSSPTSTRTRKRTMIKLEPKSEHERSSVSPPSSPLTDLEDLPIHLQPRPTTTNAKPEPPEPLDSKLSSKKKTPAKKPTIKLKLDKPHPEPKGWEKQWGLIEVMRGKIVAPVDTLGCDTPNRQRTSDPKTIRFHILISLMLSSQTKDPVTSQAVTNLHTTLPSGLNAESLAKADQGIVSECINKVGFWRRKTEYIQEAARRILVGGLDEGEVLPDGWEESEWVGKEPERGDVPRTLGGLCKLKGVGPKMAFLVLQCAWNINAGVGVDVHVHRITNRLGWHKPKTTDPEQTRLNLQSWLPNHLFKPINHVLVGFGQVICLPVGPRCDVCLLAKEKICPARTIGGDYKGRKEVGVSFEDEGVRFKRDEEGEGVLVEMDGKRGRGEAKVEIKVEQEGVE